MSRLQGCPVLLLCPHVPLGFTSAVSGSVCNSIHFHSLQKSPARNQAVCVLSLYSPVRHFVTPWTVAHQVPLSMGFSRQEYWSELPFPMMGDLPYPEIKPASLMFPALARGFFTTSATWEAAETRLVLLYHPPPASPDPDPCTSHSPGS